MIKLLHNTLVIVASLLLTTQLVLAQGIEKNLIKSFNISDAKTIQFNTSEQLDVTRWSKNYVRVQMTIYLENGTQETLTTYLKEGRYKISGNSNGTGYEINTPNLDDMDILDYERITYQVFAPNGIVIENPQTDFAFLP